MSLKLLPYFLSENEIDENYPLPVDNYSNVDFRDRVVGSSNPSKDRINPALLQDVQTAAKKAGVQISITTAISGHRPGSRHEVGNAVDIAIVNGSGWGSENIARKKGIYEPIMRFVSELERMGYKKNTGESGNSKVVLTFGFKNHHHHIHVSNTTNQSWDGTEYSNVSSPESQTNNLSQSVISPSTTTNTGLNDFQTLMNYINNRDNMTNAEKNKALLPLLGSIPGLEVFYDILKNKNSENNTNSSSNDLKKVLDKIKNDTETNPKLSNSNIKALPTNIRDSIKKMEQKYNIVITDEHINKEFEQEENSVEDAGSVNTEAQKQVDKLIYDAKKNFPKLSKMGIVSGYRSYSDQIDNFGRKAKLGGVDKTQRANALPGFSQHHSGKAFDIFSVETNWWNSNKDVKDWVLNNAGKYGFNVTYKTQGPLRIPEPWHIYYIGGESISENLIDKIFEIAEEIIKFKTFIK